MDIACRAMVEGAYKGEMRDCCMARAKCIYMNLLVSAECGAGEGERNVH